jgi:transposase
MEMLDSRRVPDEQEVMTPGEAVAGMILNGLGFTHRPLSWTPQFLANQPLDLLLHDGVEAEMFNRFTLSRTLDEVQAYGGDLLCSALALALGPRESMEQRVNHLDTPRFSRRGDSVPESEAQAMTIPQGDAKDHRPDVKQAVVALLVSQDGGVPFGSKSWDGHASETKIFQERAEALLATLQASPGPRSLVADAKLSPEDKAANLSKLGVITRIPGTRKLVTQVITPALQGDTWHRRAETPRYQRLE